jgi:ribose 1,5-bisphosphokinase
VSGRLVAVVGPSGAGKDTLIAALVARHPEVSLVRRVITRPGDAGGEDHTPMTEHAFDAAVAAGDFLVHWSAHGLNYGIPRRALDEVALGRVVVFNGSRAALPAARAAFPALEVVMITAPPAQLAQRLAGRGRESAADVAARIARASLPPPGEATLVVNDGTVAQGVARLEAALNLSTQGA